MKRIAISYLLFLLWIPAIGQISGKSKCVPIEGTAVAKVMNGSTLRSLHTNYKLIDKR